MAKVLWTAFRFLFHILVFAMTKTIILLWEIFKFLTSFVGYQRAHRRRHIRQIDMERYESYSRYIGSIRLARHETPEESFIYGNCLNTHWDTISKALLCEKNDVGAKTYCYLYSDDSESDDVQGIRVSSPISVAFLSALFDYRAR